MHKNKILLFAFLLGFSIKLKAGFINEFPHAEKVIQKINGKDFFDSKAKQIGVFNQLRRIVEVMAIDDKEIGKKFL